MNYNKKRVKKKKTTFGSFRKNNQEYPFIYMYLQ